MKSVIIIPDIMQLENKKLHCDWKTQKLANCIIMMSVHIYIYIYIYIYKRERER